MCVCEQADEGPVKEGGQPETQGAAGEEQERPADGGRQKERGQSQREFPADKGMWGGRGGSLRREILEGETEKVSPPLSALP